MSDQWNKNIGDQETKDVDTNVYAGYELHEIHQDDFQQERMQPNDSFQNAQFNSVYENSNYYPPMPEVKVKKTSGRAKKFFKKSLAIVCTAALFGVVAGASFQGIQTLSNDKEKDDTSVVGMKTFGEFEEYAKDKIDEITSLQTGSVVSTNSNITATDVSQVVENVMPAIVAINSTATMEEYDFFGRKFDNEVSGSGSGIIIGQSDEEILIATNNHVVADATAVEIEFVDKTKAPATIKGTEPGSDLAVVAVNLKDLSKETQDSIRVATLGDSKAVKAGEMAIAIGNALGYGQSVTVGYISALNREVTVDEGVSLNLIQTDAAINPGNSGGALLNASGEIIGINSVKYADTSVEGIGYAIPISEAVPIINELMNRENLNEDEMGYLGIEGKDVDESYANAFGLPVGIYISSIANDSAAEKAGLHKGDIIVGINGKTLKTMQDLSNTLTYTKGGTTVTINLKVLENGEYIAKDVEVTLGFRTEIE